MESRPNPGAGCLPERAGVRVAGCSRRQAGEALLSWRGLVKLAGVRARFRQDIDIGLIIYRPMRAGAGSASARAMTLNHENSYCFYNVDVLDELINGAKRIQPSF